MLDTPPPLAPYVSFHTWSAGSGYRPGEQPGCRRRGDERIRRRPGDGAVRIQGGAVGLVVGGALSPDEARTVTCWRAARRRRNAGCQAAVIGPAEPGTCSRRPEALADHVAEVVVDHHCSPSSCREAGDAFGLGGRRLDEQDLRAGRDGVAYSTSSVVFRPSRLSWRRRGGNSAGCRSEDV